MLVTRCFVTCLSGAVLAFTAFVALGHTTTTPSYGLRATAGLAPWDKAHLCLVRLPCRRRMFCYRSTGSTVPWALGSPKICSNRVQARECGRGATIAFSCASSNMGMGCGTEFEGMASPTRTSHCIPVVFVFLVSPSVFPPCFLRFLLASCFPLSSLPFRAPASRPRCHGLRHFAVFGPLRDDVFHDR